MLGGSISRKKTLSTFDQIMTNEWLALHLIHLRRQLITANCDWTLPHDSPEASFY